MELATKLDINSFMQASGAERFTIQNQGEGLRLVPGDLSLEQKFDGVSEPKSPSKLLSSLTRGTEAHKEENKEFKAEFYAALVEAFGEETASKAVNSVGLPLDWKGNSSVLGISEVHVITGNARENLVDDFIRGKGPDSLAGVLHTKIRDLKKKQSKLLDFYTKEDKQDLKICLTLKGYENSPELHKLFREKVSQHGDVKMAKLKEIARETYAEFFSEKKKAFADGHPFLSAYANTDYLKEDYLSFDEAYRVLLNELSYDNGTSSREIKANDPLNKDANGFLSSAWDVLELLRTINNSSNSEEISEAQKQLAQKKYSSAALIDLAVTNAGQQLAICLGSERACQLDRLEMKSKNFL